MYKIILSLLILFAGKEAIANSDSLNFSHEIELFCPNHIFVKTTLGETEGYFLIDNGTPGGSLSAEGHIALGNDPTKIDTRMYRRDTVTFPLNQKQFTLPFDTDLNLGSSFNSGYPGMTIFGIIGTNLLSSYNTTYDYINSKLILSSLGNSIPKNEMKNNLVDLHFGPQGHTFFRNCNVNNFMGLVHFDTGIQYSFGVAYDGELAKLANVKYEVMPKIKIGSLQWNNEKWFARNFRSVHGSFVYAEVGERLLSNCVVTIYHEDEMASIVQNTNIKRGGSLGVKTNSNCKVISIHNDLIANKIGLHFGDSITHINSNKVSNVYELKHYVNLWNTNSSLSIEVLRDNKIIQLESNDYKDLFEYKSWESRFSELGDLRADKEIIDRLAIAEIIDVENGTEKEHNFSVDGNTPIQIYAIGEGQNNEMWDYGWITSVTKGVVWKMDYEKSTHAGGSLTNRKIDTTIVLVEGDYILHYKTDPGHAYLSWTSPPPKSWFWGIKIMEITKPNKK